jgi:peptide/nickel transport system substrate-binding protein
MTEGRKSRRSGRGLTAALGAVLTITVLAGTAAAQSTSGSPSGSSSASGAHAPVTFTYGDVSKPTGINPMVGYTGTDYVFWAMTYDLLINYSTTDFSPDFQHSITTSVDTSSDSMSFTYHLRPNMKWSDGQPFTANDVAWTLNYYKKNEVPNYSSDLELFDHAEATDDTTVVLHSTVPTSIYSGKTVFMYEYILPEHYWGKYEDTYGAAKHDPMLPAVGSGPFVMNQYVKNQSMELDANPFYWGKDAGLVPQVDRVVYRIFGNQDAEAAALQNGEIDFGYFTSGSILNTLKNRGLNAIGAKVPSFGEIGINTGSAYQTNTAGGFKPHGDGAHALTDVVVRQAIRRAVDNNQLVQKALLGYGTPGISPVQPDATTGAWQPGPNDPDLSFNIDAANQMLDEAGYTRGANGIRVDPFNNKPLEFRLFIRSSDQPSQDMVPFFEGWMQQIGIKIDMTLMESTKLGDVILAGDYDLFEWGWYPNPDPNYILEIFTCKERPPDAATYRNSDMYYCNPDYDKLYDQQLRTTDATKRADIVHQMQSILYRDEPYVVLWNDALLEAWSPQWTGFQPQPSPDGDILATYGPLSFISLHPVSGSTSGSGGSEGIPAWVWLAIIAAVVVVGAGILIARRRGEEDEDEA